ncbi:MAG: helix-turn-helix transcriptional regulator [Sedimentibacter sp.]|uniref:helix-turn-helix domain-containing protein n=1 Tax=Sedimentibacter sp. TaxID=1960295 RepID=UPI0031598631
MKLIIDNNVRNIIGPQLKTARLKNKFTQQQLSAKLETMAVYIDRASISKLEQQKRIVTDYELLALCEILKVSPDWMLGTVKE